MDARWQWRRRGMTLLEIVFATMIVATTGTMTAWLIIAAAREQRLGFLEAQVYERADRLEDHIFRILRRASRSNVVPFSTVDLVDGQPEGNEMYYYRIIFREASNGSNQELRFDPETHQLIYDPDRAVADDEQRIDAPLNSSTQTQLDYLWFAIGMKPGGAPDASLILVQFQVSDRGSARGSYREDTVTTSGIHPTWVTSVRTFAVNLRQI